MVLPRAGCGLIGELLMFIDVAHGKLFALRHGDWTKPTIVGIGGLVASGELWSEPFAQLSDRWSTIAYDHRGSGVSVAATSSITLDNLVSDLFAVMDAYGVGRGIIASESSGALTALTAALAQPERVSHLVVVAGAYFMEPSSVPGLSDFHQSILTSYEEWVAQFIEDSTPEPDSDHLKAWGRKLFARAAPKDAVAFWKAVEGVDLRPRLGEVEQPTLVIHGRLDAIVPLESAEQLAAAIPSSKLKILDDAGHGPPVTRPTEVADAIAEFLTTQ